MTEDPILWQREPSEIFSPDDGDTFHVRDFSAGKPRLRAMSRATLIAQVMLAIEALDGPGDGADLALLHARLDRARRAR